MKSLRLGGFGIVGQNSGLGLGLGFGIGGGGNGALASGGGR